MTALTRRLEAIDAWLMTRTPATRGVVIAITLATMVAVSLPKVPKTAIDFARVPALGHLAQPDTFGTDTIADTYEAKVVLNDVGDMYTKRRLEQTPLEAQTWSKRASAPYPPAMLLTEAALFAIGARIGVGLYGMVLALAVLFIGLSLFYSLRTRWYVFPLLYLNFAYFSGRFVYVQDGSYLVMLCVVMAALLLARSRARGSHALMALAIVMKVSPLFYATELPRMRRASAIVFLLILVAGFVLPYFIWDQYLYIFQFNDGLKGRWYSSMLALAIAGPFGLALWRVQERSGFDLEDRIGWSVVPFALFLGLKMNVARHLLVVLLVPDKRGLRNLCAAAGLFLPALLPHLVRFNSALPITAVLLAGVLVWHLRQPGTPHQAATMPA